MNVNFLEVLRDNYFVRSGLSVEDRKNNIKWRDTILYLLGDHNVRLIRFQTNPNTAVCSNEGRHRIRTESLLIHLSGRFLNV